jgi:hypothetical protein
LSAPRSRALLGALALLLLTACHVDIGVGVDVHDDGTGTVRATVTLDGDAAQRVPDLANQLRVDDLRNAGWRVDTPKSLKDGSMVVQAARGFRTPAEASRIVAQLNEPNGPFRRFRLERTRSFLKTTTRFTGTVDLSRGLASFSDPQLDRQLGGGTFGVDQAQLERQAKAALDRVFTVTVAVRLPGPTTSNSARAASNGAVWRPRLGEKAELVASASQWNVQRILRRRARIKTVRQP